MFSSSPSKTGFGRAPGNDECEKEKWYDRSIYRTVLIYGDRHTLCVKIENDACLPPILFCFLHISSIPFQIYEMEERI